MLRTTATACALLAWAPFLSTAAFAQRVGPGGGSGTERVRVALGPQFKPSYPGADAISLRPFVDLSRAKDDAPFVFEAPDEGFGLTLLTLDRLTVGPALGFEGRRRSADVGGTLPGVGFTVEAGGFAQYQLAGPLRLRIEVRQGIGGHHGLIANIGGDYVARRGDDWLFSVGPRLTLANDRYTRAYFGVRPAYAGAAGLRSFDADGGIESIGAAAGYLRQLTPRWGLYAYAKYERLVADAARSPVTDRYGSKNQPSAGIALTYTFRR